MIFLTVGSWYKGFDRLVQAVDRLKEEGVITEEVVAQVGPGAYRAKNLRLLDFCSPEAFQDSVSEATVVIAHAGMGTIAEAVSRGKPIIVVPRKRSLGEHFDDHQFDTAKQLEAEGKILVAYEVTDLPARLEQARTFVPVQSTGSEDIRKAVDDFISEALARRAGSGAS